MKKYAIAIGIVLILAIGAVISIIMEIVEFVVGVSLMGILLLVLLGLYIKWKTSD